MTTPGMDSSTDPPVNASELLSAIPCNELVMLTEAAEKRVAERLRERVVERIADHIEREVQDPARMPRTEQAALALIRGVAEELRKAGQELAVAARVLKDNGYGLPANRAHQAAQRAESMANELVPQRA